MSEIYQVQTSLIYHASGTSTRYMYTRRLFKANTLFRSPKFSITVLFYHLMFVHAYGLKQSYFIYKIHFIDFNCSNIYFTKQNFKAYRRIIAIAKTFIFRKRR